MKEIKTIQEGVLKTLELFGDSKTYPKWEFIPKRDDDYVDYIILNGVKFPLFWWRYEAQIKEIIRSSPERKPCSMKLNEECSKKYGLNSLLYKNFDIAETTLKSNVKSLTCYRKPNSLVMLTTMQNDTVALYELASTLHENAINQGRHSVWGEQGMISTRVVSQTDNPQAIYMYLEDQEKPFTFNDQVKHLFGLNREDTVKALTISMILLGKLDISDWIDKDKKYRKYIDLSIKSAVNKQRIFMEEN